MSELQLSETVEKVTAFIGKQEGVFTKLNQNALNALDFIQECEFAMQLLMKNSYTLDAARLNPDSLHMAIANVAAIGITLNPAHKFAYLVPRRDKVSKELTICLDISYRGLTKLATDTGLIKALKAELVYTNDDFQYKGFHEKPDFKADVFADRGELVGVYAMALMTDGSVLVETMTIEAVNKIRDDSEAHKAAVKKGGWTLKNNVWVKYYGEMVKKTVIKRAHKTLPTSKGTEILGKAIEIINEHEGIEFDKPVQIERILYYSDEEMKEYQRCVDEEDYFNLFALKNILDQESQIALKKLCMPEAEKGKKGVQNNELARNMQEACRQVDASLNLIREALDANDDGGFREIWETCSDWTRASFISDLTPEQNSIIRDITEKAQKEATQWQGA